MTAKKESISFFTKGEVSKVDMNGLYDMIKDRSKVEEEKEQCLAEVTRLKQELEETHTKYQVSPAERHELTSL
jgi:CRISPR/Cas system CSM-associated protein Csm2 small subunit